MVQTTEKSIPRGEAGSMTLLFPQGASNLHINSGNGDHLATGHFSGRAPEMTPSGAALEIRYRRGSGRSQGELALHPDVQWTIESQKGVSNLTADLTGLNVGGLRIGGGVSRLWLCLPRTDHPTRIEIDGGAERVSILRPDDTSAVLEIQDGASKLTFDGEQLGDVSGQIRVASDTRESTSEYHITARRGVSRFSVGTSPIARDAWGS